MDVFKSTDCSCFILPIPTLARTVVGNGREYSLGHVRDSGIHAARSGGDGPKKAEAVGFRATTNNRGVPKVDAGPKRSQTLRGMQQPDSHPLLRVRACLSESTRRVGTTVGRVAPGLLSGIGLVAFLPAPLLAHWSQSASSEHKWSVHNLEVATTATYCTCRLRIATHNYSIHRENAVRYLDELEMIALSFQVYAEQALAAELRLLDLAYGAETSPTDQRLALEASDDPVDVLVRRMQAEDNPEQRRELLAELKSVLEQQVAGPLRKDYDALDRLADRISALMLQVLPSTSAALIASLMQVNRYAELASEVQEAIILCVGIGEIMEKFHADRNTLFSRQSRENLADRLRRRMDELMSTLGGRLHSLRQRLDLPSLPE